MHEAAMADDRKNKPSGTPQAGDVRALGPLGRPMTRDELVDGPDPRQQSQGGKGQPAAGDVQALGPLERPMTKDELKDGKTDTKKR
jgi:hypothetical protein